MFAMLRFVWYNMAMNNAIIKVSVFVLCIVVSYCSSLAGSTKGVTKGVWWWNGPDAADQSVVTKRMDFLSAHGVDEVYFCVDLRKFAKETRKFVKAANARGIRVALLAGDVSWIRPGSRGFAETLAVYRAYQRRVAQDERFYAVHFDVEPHQDTKLSDERKWQLYADFVLRAASDVHAIGEKIEWDIPFWLDNIKVAYGERVDVPLLEVVMDCSDCVTLMSYRDSAEAMLDVAKTELAMAGSRNIRVVLGAETGETGEGSIVTYFEEGADKMDAELEKVRAALKSANIPAGTGIAIHHLGSWEKLAERNSKEKK